MPVAVLVAEAAVAFASDKLNVVQALSEHVDELVVVCMPLRVETSLLDEVGKECSQLLFAHIHISPFILPVVLGAERWEFSNGIKEAVVGIHIVSVREQVIPLCLGKDGLDADHIVFSLVVRDLSIKWPWSCNSSLNLSIVRVDFSIVHTKFLSAVVPVFASPKPIGLDVSKGNDAEK